LFDGKVYAKGAPNSCSLDVKNSLEFELRMGYNDIDCNVRQNGNGRYLNDVVSLLFLKKYLSIFSLISHLNPNLTLKF
jgi:hypothetical protein